MIRTLLAACSFVIGLMWLLAALAHIDTDLVVGIGLMHATLVWCGLTLYLDKEHTQ